MSFVSLCDVEVVNMVVVFREIVGRLVQKLWVREYVHGHVDKACKQKNFETSWAG